MTSCVFKPKKLKIKHTLFYTLERPRRRDMHETLKSRDRSRRDDQLKSQVETRRGETRRSSQTHETETRPRHLKIQVETGRDGSRRYTPIKKWWIETRPRHLKITSRDRDIRLETTSLPRRSCRRRAPGHAQCKLTMQRRSVTWSKLQSLQINRAAAFFTGWRRRTSVSENRSARCFRS